MQYWSPRRPLSVSLTIQRHTGQTVVNMNMNVMDWPSVYDPGKAPAS